MILGYHVVLTAYGFWLPNDPRGSWSDFVRSWELYKHGPATKVTTRRSVASQAHDHSARREAKRSLKYPPVALGGALARAVGRGFAAFLAKSDVTIWACAILPEHVHLIIARHDYAVETIVNLLKGQATRQLAGEDLHPLAAFPTRTGRMPKVFARGHWKVFLESDDAIRRAIRYIEHNPLKEGKPAQEWSFVSSFDV